MGDKEKNSKSIVGCPYCTKPIPSDAGQCPYCGTNFGSQTIRILRSVVNQALFDSDEDRRGVDDRIPKKFKIVYNSGNTLIQSYLGNIGVGGVFIPTDHPMDSGTRLHVKINLPNGEKVLEVNCEVVWIRKKEISTPSGKFPSGMGVKFLNLSTEDKKKIERIIKGIPYI
jgi:type IV pilus assembly protein PilZ